MTKCVYDPCENEAVTSMGLIGPVCKECLKTKVWSYYNYTDEQIEEFIKKDRVFE